MERATTATKTKRCLIMARVNAKTICTVSHVYSTTTTVLLMWQTQHFILTTSLPVYL